MASLTAIIFLTIAAFGGLRLFAPRALRSSLGPCEFAAAIALPVLATFAHFYAVFAVGVVVIIVGFPVQFGGAMGRQARLEQQLRLGFFALPLLPMLYRDVTLGSLTLTQLNYVTLICGALFGAMIASGTRLPNARLAKWDITFAAMMLAQLFMDVRGDDFLFLLRSVLQVTLALGLPYFVFSRAIVMSSNPKRLLFGMIIAAAAIAVIALYESTRSWLLYIDMPNYVGANPNIISGYSKQRGGMLRPGATWGDSTSLSLFFAIILVMLYALRREIGSRKIVLILAGMIGCGLFISLARVGYLALVVGLAACFIYERRYARLALMTFAVPIAALGLIALAAVFPVIGSSIGLSNDAADTANYREMLNRDGMALWQNNWLIGVSMSEILTSLEHLRQGEGIIDLVNQPLTVLMRGGVVFALLYYAMTFRLLGVLRARRRRMDHQTRAIACAAFAGILAITAGLLTTSYLRNEATFVILLAIGAGTAVRRTAKQSLPPPDIAAPANDTRFGPVAIGALQRNRLNDAVPIAEASRIRTRNASIRSRAKTDAQT